jgi:hypothetical protein
MSVTNYRSFVSILVTRDMSIEYRASLLPQGEGQDEGIKKNQSVSFSNPLTPTLSLRERELNGTQQQ